MCHIYIYDYASLCFACLPTYNVWHIEDTLCVEFKNYWAGQTCMSVCPLILCAVLYKIWCKKVVSLKLSTIQLNAKFDGNFTETVLTSSQLSNFTEVYCSLQFVYQTTQGCCQFDKQMKFNSGFLFSKDSQEESKQKKRNGKDFMKISSCFACWQEIWFSSALKIDESSSRFEKDTVIVSVSFMLCVQHKSKIQKLSTVQLLWCINHSICLVQLSWVLFNSKSNWITDADDKLVEGGTLPLSYDSSILSLGGDIKILNNTICHKKTGPGEFKSKPVQGSSNLNRSRGVQISEVSGYACLYYKH